jgi:hypothetical protein
VSPAGVDITRRRNQMRSLYRKLGLAALVSLGVLIGAASTPVQAGGNFQTIWGNALATNGGHFQALTSTALIASGSTLGDLNGVAVEAVTVPQNLEY